MAEYAHASDAHSANLDGTIDAYSGVIRADGRWVACAADSPDWQKYLDWVAQGNKADPYKSPADGGVAIKLQEDEVAYGAMLDSLPPEPAPGPSTPPAGPVPPRTGPPPSAPPPPSSPDDEHSTSRTTTRTTHTSRS